MLREHRIMPSVSRPAHPRDKAYASHCTWSRSRVRNSDPLPYIKMGLYLRFDWRDVLAWLERQKAGEHNPESRASRNLRR